MADANENPTELNLQDILAKENTDVSEDERNYLVENKDLLTDEEAQKFEVQKEAKKEDEPVVPETRFKAPETPAPKKKEEGEDGGDDLFGDGKKTEKAIEEKLQPIQEQLQEARDIQDVDGYIRSNPDYAPYRDKMLTYIKHPAYRNIPVTHIATIIAGPDLKRKGAQEERETQTKVNDTKGGGSTARPTPGQPKDWGSAPKEEFDQKVNEVLGRPS